MSPGPADKERTVVCVALYCFDVGGSEMLAAVLIRHFLDRGATVIALATRRGDGPLRRRFESWGVECLALDLEGVNRVSRWLRKRRLAGWFGRHRVDVIHVHHFSVLSDVLQAAGRAGVRRTVVTEHTSDVMRNDAGFRRVVERLAPRVTVCTAINTEVRRAIAEASGLDEDRIPVIENGVDVERFSPPQQAPGTPPVRIAWLGRLHPHKDVMTGLEAFAVAVRGSGTGLHLAIAGDGPDMSKARQYVVDNDLVQNVELLGGIEDVPELLRGCHVFLMSSRTEGTPLAMLEAMACGLPVVATAVGGIPGNVTPDTAVLAPAGDAAALAEALLEVTEDPARRVSMAQAARSLAVERYSAEGMKARYADVVLADGDRP